MSYLRESRCIGAVWLILMGFLLACRVSGVTPTLTQPAVGVISGKLCYPSEGIPPMTIYARHVDTQETFSLAVPAGTREYQLQVPPGSYYLFAWTEDGIGGSYSYFVTCGLSVDCPDHRLIPVPVQAGETVRGIDICDFYDPESVPKP